MKKVNITLTDEAYEIIKEYQDSMPMVKNIDTAFDMFIKDHKNCSLSIGDTYVPV